MQPIGRLIVILGASGVGKDTLLSTVRSRYRCTDDLLFAPRAVTRAAVDGSSTDFRLTESEFDQRKQLGDFCVWWSAHGLHYGIAQDAVVEVRRGKVVIVNGSRRAIGGYGALGVPWAIIEIEGSLALRERRLAARNRESGEALNERLELVHWERPPDVAYACVRNDGTVESGAVQLLSRLAEVNGGTDHVRLFPAREEGRQFRAFLSVRHALYDRMKIRGGFARVSISTLGWATGMEVTWLTGDAVGDAEVGLSPDAIKEFGFVEGLAVTVDLLNDDTALALIRKKIARSKLSEREYRRLAYSIAQNRVSPEAIAGFMTALCNDLEPAEIVDLTRARAGVCKALKLQSSMIVDKHSLGGLPGNRVSLIVIPIVAACGLVIPKASSRAITSAAGTADTMEVFARVDLSVSEVEEVIHKTNGCIVWNGKLTHTPFDDVVNAIIAPLGLNSAKFSVASILSKKLAAGVTHLIADLPAGSGTKLETEGQALELKNLMETIGREIGITVKAEITPGTWAVGRGIGPVLEARDVLSVLKNAADAPQSLLNKALDFAGEILEWAPGVPAGGGRTMAAKVLATGRAYSKFREIVEAQGPQELDLHAAQYTGVVQAKR